MLELSAASLPQLTAYGKKCYYMSESGDDDTEIDSLAFIEFQQWQ
jgi:hypothetical protein